MFASRTRRAHVEPPFPATPPDPPPAVQPRPIREPGDEPPPAVQDPVVDNPLTPPDPAHRSPTAPSATVTASTVQARGRRRPPRLALAAVGAAALLAACNPADRQEAGQAAKEAGSSAAQAARSAGQSVMKASDDAAVTAKVKGTLMADAQIEGMRIDVDTTAGEVTLSGQVDNDAQKARAEQIALNVEGVKGVLNRLAVERKAASPPATSPSGGRTAERTAERTTERPAAPSPAK